MLDEKIDLRLTSDERGRRRSRTERFKAARGGAFTQNLPRHNRRGEALELDRAETVVIEQIAGEPARAFRNDHLARIGKRLQPRRQIWRLANSARLLGIARADEITDDHQTGGDTDANPQLPRRLDLANNVDQCQRGSNGALGIVLMRLWVAVVGEHAVAEILRNIAPKRATISATRRW